MAYNDDIFIKLSDIASSEPIAPFLVSEKLADRFRLEDNAAAFWKRVYQKGSIVSLLLIGIGISSSSAAVLFAGDRPWVEVAKVLSLASVLGLIVQLAVYVSGAKRNWLVARYATERLRSVKAQLITLPVFLEPDVVEDKERAQLIADEFVEFHIKDVAVARSHKWGALEICSVKDLVRRIPVNEPELNRYGALAQDAYQRNRVDYQRLFANQEAEDLKNSTENWKGVGNSFVFLSATLATVMIGVSFLEVPALTDGFQKGFLLGGIVLFATSAIISASDKTSLHRPNYHRYKRYEEQIEALSDEGTKAPRSFREYFLAMEGLAISELREFCDDARQLSARF
ncbi:MAG: hypothetical protein AAFR65_02800 [Pseudomonadota bacterium]